MLRVVLVFLTVGGILACPLVCRDCGHPGDGGIQDGDSDPCHAHGCVCKGAVQPPHPGPDAASATAFAMSLPAATLPQADWLGVELLSRYGDGPPPACLESGRDVRLVFQSLLL